MVDNPSEIKNLVLLGFKDHFCSKVGTSPFNLTGLNWNSVSRQEAGFMIRQFTKEEIWIALKETDSKKAPGPDGFNASWIKMLWPKSLRK